MLALHGDALAIDDPILTDDDLYDEWGLPR